MPRGRRGVDGSTPGRLRLEDHGLGDRGRAIDADLAAAALDMARRFHDGATLWVISPQWEPHAHHVAVEFVHPVIMGKRALPSVALVEPDPVAQARVASQPGDLLIAVASADEPAVLDAMRRAPAWGVLTLWIGSGPRPPAGAGAAARRWPASGSRRASRGR